ncbi:MAG: metallophosphoesterase [Deltaproteobacteria bacterium]|nr:metallophosphoesterase [Deltaproteobacteria bacterium]
MTLFLHLVLLTAPPTFEEAWAQFAEARSGVCLGPAGDLATPRAIESGPRKFELLGHRLVERSKGDGTLRVGVISAIKDDREPTLLAVRSLGAKMKQEDVDLILANGDLAEDELAMEGVFETLANLGTLVVVTTGNTESCGSFNRMAGRTHAKHAHVVNGNWARRIELESGTLITLPGYYDKRFIHRAGVPVYSQKDLDALAKLMEAAKQPVALVSHGPPRMSGKAAIDIATDAGHVGDPAMHTAIEQLGISFGIFGHILEAGGRGTDLNGTKALPEGVWHPQLYVNAGTANPDPWPLLDGKTSHGMGLVVELSEGKARYRVLRP